MQASERLGDLGGQFSPADHPSNRTTDRVAIASNIGSIVQAGVHA